MVTVFVVLAMCGSPVERHRRRSIQGGGDGVAPGIGQAPRGGGIFQGPAAYVLKKMAFH